MLRALYRLASPNLISFPGSWRAGFGLASYAGPCGRLERAFEIDQNRRVSDATRSCGACDHACSRAVLVQCANYVQCAIYSTLLGAASPARRSNQFTGLSPHTVHDSGVAPPAEIGTCSWYIGTKRYLFGCGFQVQTMSVSRLCNQHVLWARPPAPPLRAPTWLFRFASSLWEVPTTSALSCPLPVTLTLSDLATIVTFDSRPPGTFPCHHPSAACPASRRDALWYRSSTHPLDTAGQERCSAGLEGLCR